MRCFPPAVVAAIVCSSIGSTASATLRPAMRAATCTGPATETIVRRFVADFDAGKAAAAEVLFAPEPYFQWYSARAPAQRLGNEAYERATLRAYFEARVRAHERLQLTLLRARYDAGRKIVNFSGKLIRSADRLPASAPHWFKGAATCGPYAPMLIVWSM
jgi:hypothetical protein